MGTGSVEGFFGKHAEAYSRSESHAHGVDLVALIGALDPKPDEKALDVATGTGFTALALARRVRQATGIDLTKEMLDEAKELANRQGVKNTTFELGDALRLPYPDSSFDLVTTRRATHHFTDVPRFLREASRVLRDGGRLGVADMSPPAGTEDFVNRIEKLRDSSHGWAFSTEAWKGMIAEAGFRVTSAQVLDEQVSFGKWLSPVKAGGGEERNIRAAWREAPAPVRARLAAVFDRSDIIGWTKSRLVLIASKTP